jgi:hypothetical protein
MSHIIKQVWFKHINGALKNIPGIANKSELSPRLEQVVDVVGGIERPIMRLDTTYIAKITLLDENVEVRLTPKEEKLPKGVQERILARRAEEADLRIRANEAIKQSIKSYEDRGGIKVLDWDKSVDADSPENKGSVIHELSEIALADFADRGIEVPEHLKRSSVTGAVSEKSGIAIKQSLSKKQAN